jgi:hypothetical protein
VLALGAAVADRGVPHHVPGLVTGGTRDEQVEFSLVDGSASEEPQDALPEHLVVGAVSLGRIVGDDRVAAGDHVGLGQLVARQEARAAGRHGRFEGVGAKCDANA